MTLTPSWHLMLAGGQTVLPFVINFLVRCVGRDAYRCQSSGQPQLRRPLLSPPQLRVLSCPRGLPFVCCRPILFPPKAHVNQLHTHIPSHAMADQPVDVCAGAADLERSGCALGQ